MTDSYFIFLLLTVLFAFFFYLLVVFSRIRQSSLTPLPSYLPSSTFCCYQGSNLRASDRIFFIFDGWALYILFDFLGWRHFIRNSCMHTILVFINKRWGANASRRRLDSFILLCCLTIFRWVTSPSLRIGGVGARGISSRISKKGFFFGAEHFCILKLNAVRAPGIQPARSPCESIGVVDTSVSFTTGIFITSTQRQFWSVLI